MIKNETGQMNLYKDFLLKVYKLIVGVFFLS